MKLGTIRNMEQLVIRHAKLTDIDEIIRFCSEHAEYEEAEYKAEGKAEKLEHFLFSKEPRLHCLIAEIDSVPVGYATYMDEFSTWDADYYVHMDCLFIRPSHRSNGIGEELVREIARYARQKGRQVIQWQTPHFNERAIKFYHRIGATSKEKFRMYLDDEGQNKLINLK